LFRCFGLTPSSLEDAVQDVLLTAYRRLGRFDHRSSVRTWPFGIAYRVALDYRRHQRSKGRLDELSDDLPALAPQQVPGRPCTGRLRLRGDARGLVSFPGGSRAMRDSTRNAARAARSTARRGRAAAGFSH
jgi:DNA-directed RNA polymerase specialized sigma24 family protein